MCSVSCSLDEMGINHLSTSRTVKMYTGLPYLTFKGWSDMSKHCMYYLLLTFKHETSSMSYSAV